MDPVAEAKKLGWPLTAEDIIRERVQFEDRILHRHVKPEHDPAVMSKQLPSQVWQPAVNYAFGNGIIRFAESLLP